MNKLIYLLKVATILLFLFSGGVQAAKLDGKEVSIHHVSSDNCKECHLTIYKQWQRSMHAQSTALKDPIHGAFYRKVVGDPTQENVKHKSSGKYPVCLQCHSPNAALDKVTKLDAKPAYSEGVNCVTCHTFKRYKGIYDKNGKMQLGLQAYEISSFLQGPRGFLHEQGKAADRLRKQLEDEGEFNPHLGRDNNNQAYLSKEAVEEIDLPMEANSSMQTSAACLGCHDKRNNPKGVSLCQTGDEYREGKSRENCQSCHMPISSGVADHSMGGGHSLAVLKRSVRLDLSTQSVLDNKLAVEIKLKNRQPHSVPTGAPFRNMYLKVTALSQKGEILWQNFKIHPAKEDAQAFFVYTMVDDVDHQVPPPIATKPGKNTRLKPYEIRVLNYNIPASDIDSIRAELYYNLLWPGLVKKMKRLPEVLKVPKRIAWAEEKIR